MPAEPQKSPLCLGCHATGADAEDWEKDDTFSLRDGVSCEKCHGPGSEHVAFHSRGGPPSTLRPKLDNPTGADCMKCHYELLVGQPAFAETERARLREQIATTAPRPPRQVDPSVPADLEAILLKTLEREPADRYATAAELAGDLRRFLNAQPVRARRPVPGKRAYRWLRRNTRTVALVVTTVAITLAVAFALRLFLPAGPLRTATAPEPRAGTAPLIVKSPATGAAQPAPARQGQGPPPWAPGWGRLGDGRGPGPRGPNRAPRTP